MISFSASSSLEKYIVFVKPIISDSGYIEYRRSVTERSEMTGYFYPAPLNIYEVHLGSFITKDGASTRDGTHYSDYRTLAPVLAGHVKRCGFTHVELLPVMEHPYDG